MAKLALAVSEEKRLGPGRVSFSIQQRAGQLAHKAFGQSIVVYRLMPDALSFVGTGQVFGLSVEANGYDALELAAYRSFTLPVASIEEGEIRDPGVRRSLSLDEARFDDILRQAAEADPSMSDLAEASAIFTHGVEAALDAYLKVHDRVLQRWQHSCVFTGASFGPSAVRPHPGLRVTAIRPRELGGPLHVRNYLPMLPEVERAWMDGHIALGPSYGILVSERLVDPELRERLLPLGRLELPEDPARWPDPELVAWHRDNVFDRG